jgi:hypothetical protein
MDLSLDRLQNDWDCLQKTVSNISVCMLIHMSHFICESMLVHKCFTIHATEANRGAVCNDSSIVTDLPRITVFVLRRCIAQTSSS